MTRRSAALLAAAALIVGATLLHFFRYEITNGTRPYRLDRLTGTVTLCRPGDAPKWDCD